MSVKLNQVVVAGNLTRDVESKFLANEKQVANFCIAMNEGYTDSNGQKQEKTVFVDVTAWNRTAQLCSEYLRKGSQVLVTGRISQDNWEDKSTGQKRSKLFITAVSVQFLDSKDRATGPVAAEGVRTPNQDDGSDDLPF